METKLEIKPDVKQVHTLEHTIPESDLVVMTKHGIDTISHINDESEMEGKLSGVLCKGVQYYDLKNVPFISNSSLASLIDLLKSLLKQGITLKLVNVNSKIKEKIKAMGLDKFINCS